MAWKGAVRALGVDLARLLVAWGTDSVKLQSVQLGSCSERAGDLADQLRQCRFDTQELNKCFQNKHTSRVGNICFCAWWLLLL